jgi:DNA polymerase/3'-5' exonuclease PolX
MPVHNEDIASVFDEIADLLEIEGDNPCGQKTHPYRDINTLAYNVTFTVLLCTA